MKTMGKGTAWLALSVILLAVSTRGEEQKPAPAPNEAQAEAAQPAAPGGASVDMAELALEGRAVRGRVVFENDQVIRLESPDGGVIGYPKESIGGLRRFTLSRGAYEEEHGDYCRQHARQAEDALSEFAKARQAYQTAMAYAASDADRLRLKAKLEAVAAERDEWQADEARKAQIEKMRQEAELIKLEKQLTQEKLAAFRQQEEDLRRLQVAFRDSQLQMQQFANAIADLARRMDALERYMDDLERRQAVFITNTVFLDLKRAHSDLQREVERLEREVRK
jgi:vacuolar-type H+-ATPase subunit I/STV1